MLATTRRCARPILDLPIEITWHSKVNGRKSHALSMRALSSFGDGLLIRSLTEISPSLREERRECSHQPLRLVTFPLTRDCFAPTAAAESEAASEASNNSRRNGAITRRRSCCNGMAWVRRQEQDRTRLSRRSEIGRKMCRKSTGARMRAEQRLREWLGNEGQCTRARDEGIH